VELVEPLNATDHRLNVFIGSSMESLEVARTIAGWIREVGHVARVWPEEFPEGVIVFERLLQVTEEVDAAVFVFAGEDTTTSRNRVSLTPRDNVVFEFGLFAGKLGPKRAIICRSKVEHPTDLQGLTFVDVTDLQRGRRRVEEWLDRLRITPYPLGGVVRASAPLPLHEFCGWIVGAQRIRILQTFIPPVGHLGVLRPFLLEAMEQGTRVEVLLCHHDSPACQIRESALLPLEVRVDETILNNIATFRGLHSDLSTGSKSQLQVREYNRTLPALTLYQADDRMLVGSYFHGKLAISGPHLHVRGARCSWGKALEEEFERVWSGAQVVELDS